MMTPPHFINELGSRFEGLCAGFSEFPANDLARDLKKNFEATFASVFASTLNKLDLVSREEFDVQRALLAKACKRLAELEARVAALEACARGES